jgi:hypothetical protein
MVYLFFRSKPIKAIEAHDSPMSQAAGELIVCKITAATKLGGIIADKVFHAAFYLLGHAFIQDLSRILLGS